MTEKLYDKDSFLKEFTAEIIECHSDDGGYATVLDRTAFFPEGGGQPSDTGFLNDTAVFDVKIKNGVIYHYTHEPFAKGERVTGKINFDRRFDFMQQHSGEHIVSGTAHRIYGCENVGFHLSEDIVTLDFDKPLTPEQISNIEKLSNQSVFSDKEIYTYYPNDDELKAITYRSKKEIEGAVRIVEIKDTDICACCAPHVKSTGQVGLIKLLSAEKLRGGVRIEIKCGGRALYDYNERYKNTSAIGEKLAVKYNETFAAVERLADNINKLKYTVTGLKKRLTEEKVKSFCNKSVISAEFEDDFDIKEMQIYADALYKKAAGIRAVFSRQSDGCFIFAICGQADELDRFFVIFKENFTVKGGGRNGMVQGSVSADETELKKFFAR